MRSIRFVALTMLAIMLSFSLQTAAHAANSSAYRLAYVSYNDNQIWTVNPDGTDTKQITHDGGDKRSLISSPDGQYLAYYADAHPEDDITTHKVMLANLDTDKQQAMTDDAAITGLTWSPDSQQILLRSSHPVMMGQ